MRRPCAAMLIALAALAAPTMCLPFSVAAYNEYAPNSFDEVERRSPSYRFIAGMIEAGKAPGYDAGFLTRRHLTRYEFAGPIKVLLEVGEERTPEELEGLARAREDYARELKALGYEDPAERKMKRGGIFIDGDVRVRYTDADDNGKTDARLRIGTKIPIR